MNAEHDSNSLYISPKLSFYPLLDPENLDSSFSLQQTPEFKRILSVAIDLKLNITTSITILHTLNPSLPEETLINQLLDLYYKEEAFITPEKPFDMIEPMLIKTFSQKSQKESFLLKEPPQKDHFVIDIEINKEKACPICFIKENEELVQLQCGHSFCEDCLYEYLKARVLNSQIQRFPCPQEKCSIEIPLNKIKELLKEENIYEKLIKFQKREEILKNPNKKFCIKAGCEEVITKEEGIKNYGKCPCGMEICFLCGGPYHEKENCAEAMDEAFKEYLKGTDSKHCARCNQIIEKSIGCNVMACPYCGFIFCWLCLKEYKIGHYSIFNLSGCPGMDSVNIKGTISGYRRCYEKCKGIILFILKILFYLLFGILIYPLIPIICVIYYIRKYRKEGGVFHLKNTCGLVCLGLFTGVLGYIAYPFGFLLMIGYLCLCNPHVAHPVERRALAQALPTLPLVREPVAIAIPPQNTEAIINIDNNDNKGD